MNYLLLNICLCLDLILVIRAPFKSKDKRVNIYYAICFLFSLGYALFFEYTSFASSLYQLIVICSYFIIAPISIVYCTIRLNRSGLSKEAKVLIYSRHVYWIVVFLLTNAYIIFENALTVTFALMNQNQQQIAKNHLKDSNRVINDIFKYLSYG